jgi:hypothetical protein
MEKLLIFNIFKFGYVFKVGANTILFAPTLLLESVKRN